MFSVILTDNFGDKRQRSFALDKATKGIVVGRHKSCDIILNSMMVSNFHCKIQIKDNNMEKIIVTDTSSNGTQFNGADIGKNNKVEITIDDKIVINMSTNDCYFIVFSKEPVVSLSDIIVKDLDPMCYKKFCFLVRLGDGQYSRVYKAMDQETKEVIALKVLYQTRVNFSLDIIAKRELDIWKNLQHENIVKFLGVYESENNTIFQIEYCEGGDLFTRITTSGKMDEHESAFVFMQLVRGIHYLHSHNVIHRDLKPENILLKENRPYPIIKIADFGMARNELFGTTACGTVHYAAPEVILPKKGGLRYSKECDVWAIGIILYIILSGTHPFSMDNENLLYKQIEKADFNFENHWSNVSQTPKDLIKKMIVFDPSERATTEELLNSEWIERNSVFFPDYRKRAEKETSVQTKKKTEVKLTDIPEELIDECLEEHEQIEQIKEVKGEDKKQEQAKEEKAEEKQENKENN
ncbi:calcium-dependent protein kinase, putative [Entamoeba invadens IP1]|uniref:non-specific serine/threonine protein kinase n=1 Tax=Entamoeba invadens IP1 TaxID=370355 RepID=A0A0A1U2W1_ENTIV|nr:calcium-dependent protein kinase, putative [Entamoeba invadens IP1]ELP88364.1 calcium-dependent protein kinase, putative [Entamoeba invadens IP1]|eukprot:XP_004255135.1 calcium-dependent protein kinase, putative [Entamoeba invadens IP1]